MAGRTAPLTVVKPGDKAAPTRVLSITEAAAAEDQRALLVAMRARIAKTVEDEKCPPRDLASLSRRLHEIAREIEALDARTAEEANESAATADEAWDAEAL